MDFCETVSGTVFFSIFGRQNDAEMTIPGTGRCGSNMVNSVRIAYLAVLGLVYVQDRFRRRPDIHLGSILEAFGPLLGALAALRRHLEDFLMHRCAHCLSSAVSMRFGYPGGGQKESLRLGRGTSGGEIKLRFDPPGKAPVWVSAHFAIFKACEAPQSN